MKLMSMLMRFLTIYLCLASTCLFFLGQQKSLAPIMNNEFAGQGALGKMFEISDNKYQIIIIGPSYSLVSVDPDILSIHLFGKSGHVLNLSHNWMGYDVSVPIAIKAVDTFHPKILIFSIGDEMSFSTVQHPLAPFFASWVANPANEVFTITWGRHISTRIQGFLVELLQKMNALPVKYPSTNGGIGVRQGYNGQAFQALDVSYLLDKVNFHETYDFGLASQFECNWLKTLMHSADNLNVKIVFLGLPNLSRNGKQKPRLNCDAEFNVDGSVIILNKENEMMQSQYFYNDSHVNYNGQVIITHALGKYLEGSLK